MRLYMPCRHIKHVAMLAYQVNLMLSKFQSLILSQDLLNLTKINFNGTILST